MVGKGNEKKWYIYLIYIYKYDKGGREVMFLCFFVRSFQFIV